MKTRLFNFTVISLIVSIPSSGSLKANPEIYDEQKARDKVANILGELKAGINVAGDVIRLNEADIQEGRQSLNRIGEVLGNKDAKVGLEFVTNLTETKNLLFKGIEIKSKENTFDALENLKVMGQASEASKSLKDYPVKILCRKGKDEVERLSISYVLYGYRNDKTRITELSKGTTWTGAMGPGHYRMWLKTVESADNGRAIFKLGSSKDFYVPEGQTTTQEIELDEP
jgi:hypothetical protein